MNAVKNSSSIVRSNFLDYFIKENGHTFIRSSPVVPFQDPTLSFVNAGMNQFKNILLGKHPPLYTKVANSQKCIRVGGKHNDLCAVGHDTYHHTFFEMLGNWSFGDYFKKEACTMAWKFLTCEPYSIPPHRLYVTYFGGDKELGLPPDLETKEIWQSIGVNLKHIVPFGVKENFWEMGKTGPCGPCTEIHYDCRSINADQSVPEMVNRGKSELIELWNIVFIQYNRNEDKSLQKLPQCHVDTGMGFERLVAVLQGKLSNYDTDLFTPLFEIISKTSGARPYGGEFDICDTDGLDTAYRILADHTRMCTIALADNMFPDQNHKLRRIIRKTLVVAEKDFKAKDSSRLVQEVVSGVAEILSPTYPEIEKNIEKVHMIIQHESEIIKGLNKSTAKEWKKLIEQDERLSIFSGVEAVGLPSGYRDLSVSVGDGKKLLNGDVAFRLYDTHGLDVDLINDLATTVGLDFNRDELDSRLIKLKEDSKSSSTPKFAIPSAWLETLKEHEIPVTDDSAKYDYTRVVAKEPSIKPKYVFPELKSKLKAVILLENGSFFKEGCEIPINTGKKAVVIVERTNFYTEAGGQQGDEGVILIYSPSEQHLFSLKDVYAVKYAGYVLHFGTLSAEKYQMEGKTAMILPNTMAVLQFNKEMRLGHMRNHTATHLINAALKQLLVVSCQKASHITDKYLSFEFSIYGEKFNKEEAFKLEEIVQRTVAAKVPVSRTSVHANDHRSLDEVTLIPGETYTDKEISIINVAGKDLHSKEACCGTHVLNTGDIETFCLMKLKGQGTNTKYLQAVTGQAAEDAVAGGKEIVARIKQIAERTRKILKELTEDHLLTELDEEIQQFKNELSRGNTCACYSVLCEAITALETFSMELKRAARTYLRDSMELEMKKVVENLREKYLVHFLKTSSNLDSAPLQKATKLCPDLPIMIFAYSENCLKGRCCIPERMTKSLTAEAWMKSVLSTIGASGGVPRGQDPRLVYSMKPKRLPKDKLDGIVKNALNTANNVAKKTFG